MDHLSATYFVPRYRGPGDRLFNFLLLIFRLQYFGSIIHNSMSLLKKVMANSKPGGSSTKRNKSWIDDGDDFRPRITYTDQGNGLQTLTACAGLLSLNNSSARGQQQQDNEETSHSSPDRNSATFALFRTQGDSTLALLHKILEGQQGPRVSSSSADL